MYCPFTKKNVHIADSYLLLYKKMTDSGDPAHAGFSCLKIQLLMRSIYHLFEFR